ncbi:MAG TPA: DoxX family protein [Blastocatellia bacterium]|jgi:uncharacterized membrane protein YphA (DoxX/SURF4 family)
MKKVAIVARALLGLVLLVFGLDYFFHFMPELPISEAGGTFLEALLATGYLFPVIKAIEIASGVLLLAGLFVPLALALLAPVIFNIALYHLFLDPNGREIALVIASLEAFLLWAYRDSFRGLFRARAETSLQASFNGSLSQIIKPGERMTEDDLRA